MPAYQLLVKLNNPLMGTETFSWLCLHIFKRIKIVKLNNPLMGTETIKPPIYERNINNDYVKLNNPLMGTETRVNLGTGTLHKIYVWLN